MIPLEYQMKILVTCYDLVAEKCNFVGNPGKLLFSEVE